MSKIETSTDWPAAILRSLEAIPKFYGKVASTSYPTDNDPNLRIEFKVCFFRGRSVLTLFAF